MSTDGISFQIADGVLARLVGDSIVLFHPVTERLLTVTGCGKRIWELLSESASAPQIVARLKEEFDATEAQIRQDVNEFLSQLETEQIIRREG